MSTKLAITHFDNLTIKILVKNFKIVTCDAHSEGTGYAKLPSTMTYSHSDTVMRRADATEAIVS